MTSDDDEYLEPFDDWSNMSNEISAEIEQNEKENVKTSSDEKHSASYIVSNEKIIFLSNEGVYSF